MVVRKLNAHDIWDCWEIAILNWGHKKAKTWLNEFYFSLSDTKIRQKPHFFVADGQYEIVGFGAYVQSWMDEFNYNLFRINVSPIHQNKGVGKLIVNYCIAEIMKIPDARTITLCTDKPTFYSKNWNFIPTAELDDEIFMTLKIHNK